jgi:pimeloyl-ACP methyl ester carboxylesterase
MIKKALLANILSLSVLIVFALSHVFGQSHPEYIPLGGGVKAVLYRPDANPAPHVGIIIIHRTANYLQHQGCTQLSQRGFMVLCMNSRFDNNEALVDWELIALDVKRGVDYLRNTQHLSKVIFFGHSGGGPTTTFYQAVAEAGPSYCQGPNKLTQCDNSNNAFTNLTAADGIVLVDAHPGNTVNALRAINPAVNNENRPDLLQNKLDPFNPKNGYNPGGDSHYPPEFQKAYTAAQAQRFNEWIERALYIREQMQQGKWIYPDNDDITIGRGGGSQAGGGSGANLFVMDPSILCCTNQPAKLLKDNGSIITQVIKSVRIGDPSRAVGNATFDDGTKDLTVTSFLSANAIRATDSIDNDQIDWCSSNNSTPCALRAITKPLLITNMGAHYFMSDGEYFLSQAKSADKDFIVIEGATHGIGPCTACTGGPYPNVVKNFYNYVADWIKARFGT